MQPGYPLARLGIAQCRTLTIETKKLSAHDYFRATSGGAMRLIYFYLGKCCSISFNLDVNFSEDKYLKVTRERTLQIDYTNHHVMPNFYGQNIVNVSAIVGKNGVGKSSILNMLGLSRLDFHSCYPDSQWIAVYEEQGVYYLEGFNAHHILNVSNPGKSYIAYKLTEVENSLRFDSFIQYNDDIQDKYCIIHQPDFSNSITGMGSKNNYDDDDRNIGFKRNYLKTNMANFYEYITTDKGGFCSHLNKKKIVIKTKASDRIKDTDSFSFYSQFERYLDSGVFSLGQNSPPKITDQRKLFVIDLLEEYIIHLVDNAFEAGNSIDCLEMIKTRQYSAILFNYKNIKKHLLSLLADILDMLTQRGDEIIHYLGVIDWDLATLFFENESSLAFLTERNGFKDNIICSIDLTTYRPEVHSLISEFSKANLPVVFSMPKMSSGEFDINSKMAGINKAVKLTLDNNEVINGFIIVLDEYDEHLHPEWARTFLDYLLQYLSKSYADYEFQIIVSTHSPYIISDLLKENVIKIECNTSNDTYSCSKANSSFASNIYDIINDSFFLSQPIGQFATRKINNIVNSIDEVSNNSSEKDYQDMHQLINAIDDDYIKKTLHARLDSNYDSGNNFALNRLEQEIQNLTRKKEQLLNKKARDKND